MEEAEAREDLTAQGLERRMMPRCALDEEAVLLLVGRGNRMRCRIVELSLSGCRMSTNERLSAGSGTRVEAAFKVQGIAFRFAGVIEWADDLGLVGIRFIDLIPRRRDELIVVLRELEAEIAAKQEKETAKKPAEEERASQETEEQADRQAESLPIFDRLWTAPLEIQAEQTPQPQPPALAQAGRPPVKNAKRERRTQSRHEVDTTAVIFLINVGSRLSGRILDLSVGGCRIRTDDRFPVGIYTRVETEFLLEGLPFRLGGVIQAVHDRDRRLVGIRFLDVSARKREQLKQLIEEIEEMRGEQIPAKSVGSGAMAVAGEEPDNASQVPIAN